MKSVLIADDNAQFRVVFKKTLAKLSDIGEIIEAKDAMEAIALAKEHRPQLIFMDIAMPKNGLEAARLIHEELPEIKIIILTVHDKRCFIEKAFQVGAVGYLLKKSVNRELQFALEKVMKNEQYISGEISTNNKP